MSDTFQCPKCGASYARERQRIGKAVVCSCGHKFLVPSPVEDEPPAVNRSYSASSPAPGRRATPEPPRKQPSASSDSSAEVLPQAEVVYPAEVYAEPVEAADDLFSAGGAYGDPVGAGAYAAPLAPPPRRAEIRGKKKRRPAGEGRRIGFSNWVAYIVLFLLLPAAGIFTVLGVVVHRGSGPRPAATASPPAPSASSAAGLPITILHATKNAHSDEFSVEYDVGRELNSASQYIWVVSSPQGRIEFPLSTPAQGRGRVSGKPAQRAGLPPPFTSYIEEQTNGARTRVSNEVNVASRS